MKRMKRIRATTIGKVCTERGFEGTLQWIEEKNGRKLSYDLETITYERDVYFLRHLDAEQQREIAREAKKAADAESFRIYTEAIRARKSREDPARKSPEEVAADQARAETMRQEAEAMRQAFAERDAAAAEHRKMIKEIVDTGYKALAKKHHPDVGGSTDEMQKLSKAHDALKTRL